MPKLLNVFLSEFVQMAKCRKEGRKGPTINQQSLDSQIPLQYKQPYITETYLIFVTDSACGEKFCYSERFQIVCKHFHLRGEIVFLVGNSTFCSWTVRRLPQPLWEWCGMPSNSVWRKTEPTCLSVEKKWQISCMHWWPGGKSCSIFQRVRQMAVIISMSHSPETQLETISNQSKYQIS